MKHALGAAVASCLLLTGLIVAPSYADGGATEKRAAVSQTKRLVVTWHGERRRRVYQKSANVPGVGQVDLVCKPKSTILRIRPANPSAESQMWLAKFEQKGGRDVVAVKNVRVYRYANADDDGRGGTGVRAHEGVNQQSPIEDFSKGSAYGVISQRPGRNQDGGGAVATPVTSFQLTWWWERFRHPGSQYCRMALTLRTETAEQFGLSWHGAAEGAARTTSTTAIAGVGEVTVTCSPDGLAADQTVAFRPTNPATAFLDVEYVQGEGAVEEHIDRYPDLGVDPTTGLLGPVDLPRNGMMRLWVSVDGVKRGFVLSSYYVVNNTEKPWLNVCEVAAAPL
jgi:hypothetical protein